MAANKNEKDAYSVISKYSSIYKDRYGTQPIVNKYKEKWAMSSLIEDFGLESVSLTLEYYFKLNKDGHPLSWFFNNFSNIHMSRISSEKDDRIRAEARARTLELRSEFINGVS